MPFVSEKQRRYMYANHPRIARRWESHTPDTKLPETAKEALLRACKTAGTHVPPERVLALVEKVALLGPLRAIGRGLAGIGRGVGQAVGGVGQAVRGVGNVVGGVAQPLRPVGSGALSAGKWTVDQLRKATGLAQLSGEKALAHASRTPAMQADADAVLNWLTQRGHRFGGGLASALMDPIGQISARATRGGRLYKAVEQMSDPQTMARMLHGADPATVEAARRLMSTHSLPHKGKQLALPEFVSKHKGGVFGLGPMAVMAAPAVAYSALGGGDQPAVLGGTQLKPAEPGWTSQLTAPVAGMVEGMSPGLAEWIRANPGAATAVLGALTAGGGYGLYRMLSND